VEIIRRRNSKNKAITSILENIYEIDKPVIEEVEAELKNKLAQDRIDRREVIAQVNREELERKKHMIRDDNLINGVLETKHRERYNINSDINTSGVKNHIGINARETDDFIGDHMNLLKNNEAAGAAGGGGELNLDSDMFDNSANTTSHDETDGEENMYDIYNNRTQNEYCNSINDVITKQHMKSGPLLNKCKNF
jgi:hypothetical protein